MKVDISEDCADEIMETCLVQMYKDVKGYLKDGNAYHEDDVKAFKEVLEAMNVIGPWAVQDWKKRIK